MKPRLLLVDDDPLISESLAFVLAPDFDVTCATDRAGAVSVVRGMPAPPQLALVDLGLPPVEHLPTEGFKLIGDLLAHVPDLRIVVLTGQNEESNARRARALGAADFVPKPCDPEELRTALRRAAAAPTPPPQAGAPALIGESPAMRKLRSQVDLYASSAFPTLIEGESGSGKERVAFLLHELSPRARAPFLALNCAAISPTLVEPTLFGFAKGSFTGAAQAKAGYFEDAGEGTLFLDEIGELPVDLQAKLLRVLENGEYQRVGETQTRTSRARIVAATNRDLRDEIRKGRFRTDLYHRLSVFTIAVPPLRELGEDKLRLLDHFRLQFCERAETRPFTLDEEARVSWLAYPFPGNVRELRNIVIRLGTKLAGYTVRAEDLAGEFASDETPVPESPDTAATARIELASGRPFSLDAALKAHEATYLDAAIELSGGNMSRAAKLLGISRSTLYSRLEVTGRAGARLAATDAADAIAAAGGGSGHPPP
jgi:two-component system nitrogen regulation response regulator GlnG